MVDKTIAYSNSGGFWKTRYTFVSSCYAFVDRCLISFNKFFTEAPVWKHDDNGVARTKFYGGEPSGSGIAVTFNENPSQNKLYKAFSLESTNNIAGGLNIFTVNNSSNPFQRKEIEVGLLEDRGGIMYGHIGRETVASGANVKLVGRIMGNNGVFSSAVIPRNYMIQFAEGGKSNLSKGIYLGDDGQNVNTPAATAGSKFFIYNASPTNGQAQYFTLLSTVGVGLPTTYTAFPSDLTLYNQSFAGGNTSENDISLAVDLSETELFNSYGQDLLDEVYDTGNLYLYSISPEAVNAEDPKGQTADAVISLGSEPYELYALNVEYSPTDLDHSK